MCAFHQPAQRDPGIRVGQGLKMVSMAKIKNDPATAQMVLHTLMTDPKMKKMMIKEMLSDKNFMSDLDQERASQGRGG